MLDKFWVILAKPEIYFKIFQKCELKRFSSSVSSQVEIILGLHLFINLNRSFKLFLEVLNCL